ncbi:helix-turn-helix domain-containing protein [Halorarum salinum]|uniref:Helix-turn-helix domain-containing protein n=1 Tax=Halorarum salinum TaxID=2743089 RepID=A0A7D5QCV6_9EURY|nr:helix-turn-helix domain-containing protein [Halobaculum salinum]
MLASAGGFTPTRRAILEHIEAHPGVHFSELVRNLDVASGQVQYHLRKLLSNGQVAETYLYGRTHYYPPEYDAWERGALALFRRETAREILLHLLERGPSTPRDVVGSLDIARSTLEWHLEHLVEQGLVDKEYDGGNGVVLTVAHPQRTVQLLTGVIPSASDQLVDRFLRFVDQLFAGGDGS